MDEKWVLLLKDVGFPIAVASYVLLRLDRRLGEVSRRLTHLALLLVQAMELPPEEAKALEDLAGLNGHRKKDDAKESA